MGRREVGDPEVSARVRSALDTLLEGFQILGFDWRYLYVNDAAAAHGRREKGELLGRTIMEAYPGVEETEMFGLLSRCMEQREPARVENEFTYPDGGSRWFELSIEPVPEGVCVLSIDVTERHRLEAELMQAQKMEAIGRLAGGVAHDFNNLLTVINSLVIFTRNELPEDHVSRDDLQEVLEATHRAEALTNQLLAFSRRRTVRPRALDMGELVAGAAKMIRRVLREDIQLVTRNDDDLWTVHADSGALEQVLLNLAVNARDAMPDGGKLTIETANRSLERAYAASEHVTVPAGEYVVLAVSDEGAGMDRETLEQVFEPFFTTKGPGKGTGLGLSTCFGIVKQAGGYIWARSEPGEGATFCVYLPRHAPA